MITPDREFKKKKLSTITLQLLDINRNFTNDVTLTKQANGINPKIFLKRKYKKERESE